jgi:hypothetical protein
LRGSTNAPIDRIADAIQDYLAQHPGAADSELGVAQWWLQKLCGCVTVEDVRTALERLQQAGVVERLIVPGAGSLWRAMRQDTRGQ